MYGNAGEPMGYSESGLLLAEDTKEYRAYERRQQAQTKAHYDRLFARTGRNVDAWRIVVDEFKEAHHNLLKANDEALDSRRLGDLWSQGSRIGQHLVPHDGFPTTVKQKLK